MISFIVYVVKRPRIVTRGDIATDLCRIIVVKLGLFYTSLPFSTHSVPYIGPFCY